MEASKKRKTSTEDVAAAAADDDDNSLSGSAAAAAPAATTATHTCQLCTATFPSRNKLYKHVAVCAQKQRDQAHFAALRTQQGSLESKYIYVLGGRLRGRTLGSVERFSLAKGVWEAAPKMLENRGSHGAAACGSRLFALGGGGFDSNLATCEEFTPSTGTWSPIAPMATYRHALSVVAMEVDRDTFVGRQTAIAPVADVHRAAHTSIPLVFCVGGWMDGTVCSGHVEAYDVLTNTWHQCAPLLLPRKLHGAAAVGHELIVFGGNGDDVALWHTAAVESYDLTTNAWTKKKDLPAAGPCSAVAVGDVVYVLLQGKRVYRYDHRADEYVPLAPLPLKEWFTFDVCAHGHKIYVTGGASEGVWSKAFWSYDCVTDAWTQLPDMLQQRRRCASALVTVDP
jgi:hypothetical protein